MPDAKSIDNAKKIKFRNLNNQGTAFDMIRIEELMERNILDHSIDEHHKVEFYILMFIQDGKGQHNIDFHEFDCSQGTILTIRKDQIHRFYKESNLQGVLLIFTNDFLIQFLEEKEVQKTMLLFNELLGNPKIQLKNLALEQIAEHVKVIEKEYFSINDSYSLSIIRSQLHTIVILLLRIKEEGEYQKLNRKYLKEFIRFQELVEERVSQTSKVKDYAKSLGVSTKTLNNITKSIVHKSAKAFVDEINTKQIKRLLVNTKLSIKEIAYKSGFEETTNFYKYFKRQTQTTPEQFRALK